MKKIAREYIINEIDSNNIINDNFPSSIYTREDLFGEIDNLEKLNYPDSLDDKIINYLGSEKNRNYFLEGCHDVFMELYLRKFMANKKAIGIMGHASTSRESDIFLEVAALCREFAKQGVNIIHGGGPGLMEAAAFGAYFASYATKELHDALKVLQQAPLVTDKLYRYQALKVINDYPPKDIGKRGLSVAVPTWAFSTEPSTIFSDVFAKFFDDGKREYVLLEHSNAGIVFSPGGPGTLQEFFEGEVINCTIKKRNLPYVVYHIHDKGNLEELLMPLIQAVHKNKEFDIIFSDNKEETINYLMQ